MGFYYDDLLAKNENTFKLYLYKNTNTTDNEGPKVTDTSKINLSDSSDISLLLTGISTDNPNISIVSQWGSASTLLSDIGASIGSTISNIGLQLKRLYQTGVHGWEQLTNMGGESANSRAYTQEATYNINEYVKTFKGMGNNTPLSRTINIYPYVDSNTKNYITVESQLNTLLSAMYNSGDFTSDVADDDSSGFSEWIDKILKIVTVGDEKVDTSDKKTKVLKFKAPHGYDGVPTTFLDGKWMQGTLAIQYNGRWLYNLLLNELNISVSRWNVMWKNSSTSLEKATIAISLIPAMMITPNEQIRYLYTYNTEDTKKLITE